MELLKLSTVIQGQEAQILSDSTYLKGARNLPLVIFAHGYKRFKDWGAWHLGMDLIAKSGAFVVKFNFSKNGTTIENPTELTNLEAFANNTYSLEQKDLKSVIDFYKTHPLVDPKNIIIIGHSRAGGNVILQGCYNKEVTKVVIWAGVADFKKRFPQRQRFDTWKKQGVFYVRNLRTNQMLPQNFSFWIDFEDNFDKLNIQKAAQNLKKPTLIIHGTKDESVNIKEADLLHLWIKNSILVTIKNANHSFATQHPFQGSILPRDFSQVIRQTIDFIYNKDPKRDSIEL